MVIFTTTCRDLNSAGRTVINTNPRSYRGDEGHKGTLRTRSPFYGPFKRSRVEGRPVIACAAVSSLPFSSSCVRYHHRPTLRRTHDREKGPARPPSPDDPRPTPRTRAAVGSGTRSRVPVDRKGEGGWYHAMGVRSVITKGRAVCILISEKKKKGFTVANFKRWPCACEMRRARDRSTR